MTTYYNVGKLLVVAQGGELRAKYCDGLIKNYSRKLMVEIDKKYSYRNLMSMRKYYLIFKDEKLNALRSLLSWTHYRELLVLDDSDAINYYIKITLEQNLSYRQLHDKIKNNEYGRLDELTKNKLINHEENKVGDFVKNPIIIRNKNNIDTVSLSEKMLKQLILEDIDNFLDELGNGFTYIRNEYKIKIGYRYNFIDILLFNIKYNCYVVVELKVTELKKEHIGQIEIYMN